MLQTGCQLSSQYTQVGSYVDLVSSGAFSLLNLGSIQLCYAVAALLCYSDIGHRHSK